MNKLLKLTLIGVGVLVAVFVVAAVVVPLLVDPNDYKDNIVALVKKQTGRDLRIDGDIGLSVFPWLAVDLNAVELGNAPGFSAPYFARLDTAKIRVRLLPLLTRRLEAGMVTLHGFSVNLEKAKDGRTNWQDLAVTPSEKVPDKGMDNTGTAALAIGGLDIRDAAVTWNDAATGQSVTVDNIAVRTSAVTLVDPLDVNIRFDVNSEQLGLQGNVSMDTRIAADLGRDTYRAEDLKISADVKGKGVPGGSVGVLSTGEVAFDANHRILDLSRLKIEAVGMSFPPYDAAITAEAVGKGDLAGNQFDLSVLKITAAVTGGKDKIVAEVNAKLHADMNNRNATVSDIVVNLPAFNLNGISADLTGTARADVDLVKMTVEINDLNLGGSVSGKDIPGDKLPVSLTAGVKADLKNRSAVIKPLRLQALDLTAKGTITVTDPSSGPQMNGAIDVAPFNLRTLLTRIVKNIPRTSDPKALGSASLSTTISATSDTLRMDKLAVTLDGAVMKGSAGVENFSSPALGFDLAVDQFVVDRYLPPSDRAGQAAAVPAAAVAGVALPLETLRKLSVNGRLKVGSLTASGVKMSHFDAAIKAKDGIVQLAPVRAELYKGTWTTGITLDARTDTPRATFEESADNVRLDLLLKDMGIQAGPIDVGGPSKLTVKGNIIGDPGGKIFHIEKFAANGDVGGRLTVGLDGSGTFDLGKEQLRSERLTVHLGDLAVQGKLAMDGFSNITAITASVSAPVFDLRKVLKQIGMPPDSADPKALSAVSMQASLNGDAKTLNLENFELRLDETTVTGVLKLSGPSYRTYAFDINVDQLDADRYLPPPAKGNKKVAATPGAALAILPVDTLRRLRLDGKLTVKGLKLANMTLENIQMTAAAKDGLLTLHPATMTLYSGTYSGHVEIDARDALPRISLDEKLTGVQAGPLTKDMAGRPYLSGLTDMGMKLTATGADVETIGQSLGGTVSFDLADGSIYGMDLVGTICRTLAAADTGAGTTQDILGAVLKAVVKQARPKSEATAEDRTKFSELHGSMTFDNGIGTNNDLVLNSPLLRIGGKGKLDLPGQRLDYLVTAVLVKSCEGQGGRNFEELSNYPIPLRIFGPIDNLAVQPDLKTGLLKLLGNGQKTPPPTQTPPPAGQTSSPPVLTPPPTDQTSSPPLQTPQPPVQAPSADAPPEQTQETSVPPETPPADRTQEPEDAVRRLLQKGLQDLLKK